MKVYAPGCFWIKSSKASADVCNFWYLMCLIKDVDKKHAMVMERVLRTTRTLLILRITYNEIRDLGVQRIQARARNSNARVFELSKTLNFNADDYSEKIDWKKETVSKDIYS